jgi:hypothetical protein
MKKAARLVAREPVSREREIVYLQRKLALICSVKLRLIQQTITLERLRKQSVQPRVSLDAPPSPARRRGHGATGSHLNSIP